MPLPYRCEFLCEIEWKRREGKKWTRKNMSICVYCSLWECLPFVFVAAAYTAATACHTRNNQQFGIFIPVAPHKGLCAAKLYSRMRTNVPKNACIGPNVETGPGLKTKLVQRKKKSGRKIDGMEWPENGCRKSISYFRVHLK